MRLSGDWHLKEQDNGNETCHRLITNIFQREGNWNKKLPSFQIHNRQDHQQQQEKTQYFVTSFGQVNFVSHLILFTNKPLQLPQLPSCLQPGSPLRRRHSLSAWLLPLCCRLQASPSVPIPSSWRGLHLRNQFDSWQ